MIDAKTIDDIADWISNLAGDQVIYSLALRHDCDMRTNLKSANKWTNGHGQGKFLECYVYELLKTNLANSSQLSALVRKGADLSKREKPAREAREDGIRYSPKGEIKIYENGTDLAEIDVTMILTSGELILCEVVRSGNNLTHEDKEFSYKKRLLSYLFGRDIIGFLVSVNDLTKKDVVQRLLKDESNRFVLLRNPPKDDFIRSALFRPIAADATPSDKLLGLPQLEIKNNSNFHNLPEEYCNKLLNGLRNGRTFEDFRTLLSDSLLKNLYLFEVEPKFWPNFLSEYTFKIKNENVKMSDLNACSGMAIIGLSLTHLRPTIYLKVKKGIAYLKFVPAGSFEFKFEGTVPHSKRQHIPAYRGCIRVADEEEVNTAKDFIRIFNRDELRDIKRDQIPDYNWIQSLCPAFSKYLSLHKFQ